MSRGSADEPSQRDHLNFKHIKLSILQCVVDFIYTGELNVTTNSLNDVLEFCSELNLHEAVKVCQDTLKVCQNTSCTKLAINDDHTIAESNTTENRLAFADPELSSQLVSDHYEDSTDAETVVQPEIKVKLKTNKTNRKRSHSALGEQKDREKKRKKKSKKEDGLVKTLKVPKISILFKEKKKRDISGETKPSRRKQLKPEKKPKVKKNMKLTGILTAS